MSEFVWIVLCLFSSIGITQCIMWIAARRRGPKGLRSGYHVISLYDDPVRIEAQLRHDISHMDWSRQGSRVAILVDGGLGGESEAICERFVREYPGLLRCGADRLPQVIRELDRLQDGGELPAEEPV